MPNVTPHRTANPLRVSRPVEAMVRRSFQCFVIIVLYAFRLMVMLNQLGNLRVVFEDLHYRDLELRLLPSLHLLEVHQNPFSSCVVVHNKNGAAIPLDDRNDFVLLYFMIGGQCFSDLSNNLIGVLNPNHLPRPFDVERFFVLFLFHPALLPNAAAEQRPK